MFNLIYANTIGSSHVTGNMPCQDYGLVKETEKYKIFVVSDGHGDPRCFRSDRGSRFICEVIEETLPAFIDSVIDDNNIHFLYDLNKGLLKQLSVSVIGKWLCRIEDDLEADPITAETIAAFEASTNKTLSPDVVNDYLHNIRTEKAYGCTLIAGIASEDFLFLMHHGDGKCIIIDEDGDAIQPVPWDDRCVGSITTSCCDSDATDSIRYSIINLQKHKVAACFLASDGVEDSFGSTDSVYSYFFDNIIYALENNVGAAELSEYIADYIPTLSQLGSADDITISGIIDFDACMPFLEKFRSFSKKVALEGSLEKANDKIRSILSGGLYTHLKKLYTDVQNEYDSVTSEYENLCADRDKLERKLSSQSQQMTDIQHSGDFDIKKLLSVLQNLYRSCKDSFIDNDIDIIIKKLSSTLNKIDELKQKKDSLQNKLDEVKRDFEKIDNEYNGYVETKNRIEKQLAEMKR